MTSTLRSKSIRRSRTPLWAVGFVDSGQSTVGVSIGGMLLRPAERSWRSICRPIGPLWNRHRGFQEINIDEAGPNKEAEEDGESEWLYFFHYDSPSDATNGPIGGIIYDAQQGTELVQSRCHHPVSFSADGLFCAVSSVAGLGRRKGPGLPG